MRKRLRNLPLRQKLALLIIATTVSAQLLAAAGLLVWNLVHARNVLAADLQTQSRVVVDNVAAALNFGDPDAAAETLRGLRARSGFAQACLYNARGELFASVVTARECDAAPGSDGPAFDGAGLIETSPVIMDEGRRIGTLRLRSTLEPVAASLRAQSVGIALVLLVSSIASLVLMARFRRLLTSPLLELAATAKAVSSDRDYTRRVSKSGNDEIGAVADAFNDMMQQIHLRDDELQRALRLKDEFLATVSHELRTPLNAIIGWVHMFRSPHLSPELAAEAAEAIDRNAQRQVRLIEDILDVSRIVTGKLRLEPRSIDLSAIVESAIDVVHPSAVAKEQSLTIDLLPEAPMLGDPDRVRQIVWNLLSNAVKFTPRGGQVAIRIFEEPDTYGVEVRDSGAGIEREFLPHVFDPFRQADGSSTRAHGGLGLGLAIARHLTELSCCRIDAASEGAGSGATFTVHFPRPVQTRPAALVNESIGAAPGWQRLDGRSILLVDDDSDTRRVLGALLAGQGAAVATAASVAEAREQLAQRTPDVVVTDLAMPGEDGYSMLRYCRDNADPLVRSLPVIALTAYAGEQARASVVQAGFDAYLTKPIDPAMVSRVIGTIVRGGAVPPRAMPT